MGGQRRGRLPTIFQHLFISLIPLLIFIMHSRNFAFWFPPIWAQAIFHYQCFTPLPLYPKSCLVTFNPHSAVEIVTFKFIHFYYPQVKHPPLLSVHALCHPLCTHFVVHFCAVKLSFNAML